MCFSLTQCEVHARQLCKLDCSMLTSLCDLIVDCPALQHLDLSGCAVLGRPRQRVSGGNEQQQLKSRLESLVIHSDDDGSSEDIDDGDDDNNNDEQKETTNSDGILGRSYSPDPVRVYGKEEQMVDEDGVPMAIVSFFACLQLTCPALDLVELIRRRIGGSVMFKYRDQLISRYGSKSNVRRTSFRVSSPRLEGGTEVVASPPRKDKIYNSSLNANISAQKSKKPRRRRLSV